MTAFKFFVRFATRDEVKAFFDAFLHAIDYDHIGDYMIYASRSWGFTGFVEVVASDNQANWDVYAELYLSDGVRF